MEGEEGGGWKGWKGKRVEGGRGGGWRVEGEEGGGWKGRTVEGGRGNHVLQGWKATQTNRVLHPSGAGRLHSYTHQGLEGYTD